VPAEYVALPENAILSPYIKLKFNR
jgi:hypothetical protein